MTISDKKEGTPHVHASCSDNGTRLVVTPHDLSVGTSLNIEHNISTNQCQLIATSSQHDRLSSGSAVHKQQSIVTACGKSQHQSVPQELLDLPVTHHHVPCGSHAGKHQLF